MFVHNNSKHGRKVKRDAAGNPVISVGGILTDSEFDERTRYF